MEISSLPDIEVTRRNGAASLLQSSLCLSQRTSGPHVSQGWWTPQPDTQPLLTTSKRVEPTAYSWHISFLINEATCEETNSRMKTLRKAKSLKALKKRNFWMNEKKKDWVTRTAMTPQGRQVGSPFSPLISETARKIRQGNCWLLLT